MYLLFPLIEIDHSKCKNNNHDIKMNNNTVVDQHIVGNRNKVSQVKKAGNKSLINPRVKMFVLLHHNNQLISKLTFILIGIIQSEQS